MLAIVVQALLRIAGRALDTRFKIAIAGAAFVGLFLFDVPFPLIVLGAGIIGIVVAATRPDWLTLKPMLSVESQPRPPLSATFGAVALWATIWAAPMVLVFLMLGPDHILWQIGSFFSRLAVVTFGGAYAVLAYMAQEAVHSFGWLRPREMADGLGLAETTPGPLILVTQHVGFLAAFRAPAPFSPIAAGLLGAALTTWVTFAPCFLWIMTFAPWIDQLRSATRLKGGLAALTAAVVGVIAKLSVWFALHVLFTRVDEHMIGPIRIDWPEWTSIDWRAGALAIVAAFVLFRMKWSVFKTLALLAASGLVVGQL